MMPIITGLMLSLCRGELDKDKPTHIHFELPVWNEEHSKDEAYLGVAVGKWYPETDEYVVNVKQTAAMNEQFKVQQAMDTFKKTLEDMGVSGEVVAIDTNDPDVMSQIKKRVTAGEAKRARKKDRDEDDDALPGQYL